VGRDVLLVHFEFDGLLLNATRRHVDERWDKPFRAAKNVLEPAKTPVCKVLGSVDMAIEEGLPCLMDFRELI
jgi:hypothetical protein